MSPIRKEPLIVFTLDSQRYALYLSETERVVRACEVTSLPKAPDIVMGVINLEGRVIPVVNVRKRFRLPEREVEPSDSFIIARASKRTVALAADSVSGVIEPLSIEETESAQILPRLEYVEGVVKLKDGLILIHDIDTFLSFDEAKKLDEALKKY